MWLSILSQFPEDFVYARCLELALCITTTPSAGNCNKSYFYLNFISNFSLSVIGVPASQIMTLMGQILSSSTSTSSENKPVKMLQIVWPYMAQLENIDAYVNCTEAWMPYLIRNWRVYNKIRPQYVFCDQFSYLKLILICSPKKFIE